MKYFEWRKKQLSRRDLEYVFENNDLFIIVFNSNREIVNYEINKSELINESYILKTLNIVKNLYWVTDEISNELYNKVQNYITNNKRKINV